MLHKFLPLIIGIALIILSYVAFKYSSIFKDRIDKSNQQKHRKITDEILTPNGNDAFELARYVFGSVMLFIFGLLLVMFGIGVLTGVVTTTK